jgi:hypothetical protein
MADGIVTDADIVAITKQCTEALGALNLPAGVEVTAVVKWRPDGLLGGLRGTVIHTTKDFSLCTAPYYCDILPNGCNHSLSDVLGNLNSAVVYDSPENTRIARQAYERNK